MPIRAKFKPTSEGEFHPGIPARDLEDDEYRALDADQRRIVRSSALYEYVQAKDLDKDAPDDEDDEQEAPTETAPAPPPAPAAPAEEGAG